MLSVFFYIFYPTIITFDVQSLVCIIKGYKIFLLDLSSIMHVTISWYSIHVERIAINSNRKTGTGRKMPFQTTECDAFCALMK